MAIEYKIIKIRAGLEADLDTSRLLPRELAIATDSGKMWFCYSAGNVKRLATEQEIQALASGSPSGVYDTLVALQTAYPTGDDSIYVVTADGNWYYWSGATWTSGGVYQSVLTDANNVSIDDTGNYYYNTNVETVLQEVGVKLNDLNISKLDIEEDTGQNVVVFSEAISLANILTGERHETLFGKIKKFFSFIGTTALTTTAQTISGAINELKTNITSINTNTWVSLTKLNGLTGNVETATHSNYILINIDATIGTGTGLTTIATLPTTIKGITLIPVLNNATGALAGHLYASGTELKIYSTGITTGVNIRGSAIILL